MINKSKQDWTPGKAVNVGFLQLEVVRSFATPGDYLPDAYLLVNATRTQLYKFVPHNGLEKISAEEANELISEQKALVERLAAEALSRAHVNILDKLIA